MFPAYALRHLDAAEDVEEVFEEEGRTCVSSTAGPRLGRQADGGARVRSCDHHAVPDVR